MKTPLTHHRLILTTLALVCAGAFLLLTTHRGLTTTAAPAVPTATLTVVNANDSGAGSLRQAILDAASGDTIDFSLSGCPCTITLTSGELTIDKDLAISGPGASVLTISGNDASRVFFINPGAPGATEGPPSNSPTVNFANLTMANGKAKGGDGGNDVAAGGGGGGAAGMGGALFVNGGSVTIDGVNFVGNEADGGTAVLILC